MIFSILYFIGCVVAFIMIKNRNKTLRYRDTMSIQDAFGNSVFSWFYVLVILWSRSNLSVKFNKWCVDFEKGSGQ